jgi:putative DNA primase/helicase
MDGQKHRISVEGEKHSEKAGSGSYVGHLDGHPAGYMKNNKTGIDMKWKSKGYALDPEHKAQMQAEATEKLQARAAEQERLHEQTAQRVGKQMTNLVPVTEPTTYIRPRTSSRGRVFSPTSKAGKPTSRPCSEAVITTSRSGR